MKMMGLPNWVHWSAWFTKNLLFLLISVVIFVIVLKVNIVSPASLSTVNVVFVTMFYFLSCNIYF